MVLNLFGYLSHPAIPTECLTLAFCCLSIITHEQFDIKLQIDCTFTVK